MGTYLPDDLDMTSKKIQDIADKVNEGYYTGPVSTSDVRAVLQATREVLGEKNSSTTEVSERVRKDSESLAYWHRLIEESEKRSYNFTKAVDDKNRQIRVTAMNNDTEVKGLRREVRGLSEELIALRSSLRKVVTALAEPLDNE